MKRKMVQCASPVNKGAVSRTNIGGVEHIVVSSFTLPDNVVMNGGLYPAEEIAKSFMSLEDTLAPVEHPQDNQGNYISATSSHAIHNFHAGAFNTNISRENGRVKIEKHINVQEAMKTDRGKRLLDRIDEIENNESPRPVHTSVGVFLSVEELDEPQTNAAGDEILWIARDMFFDHDAILLDSVGAATPNDGVGLAVNVDGEKVDVERIVINSEEDKNGYSEMAKEKLTALLEANGFKVSAEGPSFMSVMEELNHEIHGLVTADWIFVADVFPEEVIFETNQGFFSVPWSIRNGHANLSGIPIRVDRITTYQPKVNSQQDGGSKAMFKTFMVNALTDAGISVEGSTDEEIVGLYGELLKTNASEGNDDDAITAEVIANAVTEALKPLQEEITDLKTKVNAGADDELKALAKIVGNSDKFPGLDEEAASLLPVEKLKEMSANCGSAHGVPFDYTANDQDETYNAPTKMPGDE